MQSDRCSMGYILALIFFCIFGYPGYPFIKICTIRFSLQWFYKQFFCTDMQILLNLAFCMHIWTLYMTLCMCTQYTMHRRVLLMHIVFVSVVSAFIWLAYLNSWELCVCVYVCKSRQNVKVWHQYECFIEILLNWWGTRKWIQGCWDVELVCMALNDFPIYFYTKGDFPLWCLTGNNFEKPWIHCCCCSSYLLQTNA